MPERTFGWRTSRPIPIRTALQSIPAITTFLCPCRPAGSAPRKAATVAWESSPSSRPAILPGELCIAIVRLEQDAAGSALQERGSYVIEHVIEHRVSKIDGARMCVSTLAALPAGGCGECKRTNYAKTNRRSGNRNRSFGFAAELRKPDAAAEGKRQAIPLHSTGCEARLHDCGREQAGAAGALEADRGIEPGDIGKPADRQPGCGHCGNSRKVTDHSHQQQPSYRNGSRA